MNTLATEIIAGILAVIIIGLTLWGNYEKWRCEKLTNQVHAYETQISTLETDAIKQRDKLKDAEDRAETQLQKNAESTAVIIAENVPHDCNDAVKWGVAQAKKI